MIWMELLGVVGSALAIAGVVLNNRKMIACFPIWAVSNTICLIIHAWAASGGESPWSMLIRDAIFLVLAFEGYWIWRKKGVE